MNFEKLNRKTIEQAFLEFDRENPAIYRMFEEYAFRWIARQKENGRSDKKVKISSKFIIGAIKWNRMVETKSNDKFKINDAYTAHYARKFIKEHPELMWEEKGEMKCVFEMRELRARKELTLFG